MPLELPDTLLGENVLYDFERYATHSFVGKSTTREHRRADFFEILRPRRISAVALAKLHNESCIMQLGINPSLT